MKRKTLGKHLLTGIASVCLVVSLTACSATKESKVEELPSDVESVEQSVETEASEIRESAEETVDVSEEVAEESMEESTEEAVVEETEPEVDTSQLTNEEWVDYLDVKRPTFLVFNAITGERKAFEDGAEYTLVEGDELAIKTPSRWSWKKDNNILLYDSSEYKYNCVVYSLNYDLIGENTEFTVTYENRDEELVPVTIYLSK